MNKSLLQGNLLPDVAHTFLLCASPSYQMCRLMRHRSRFPPLRLVSHRILGRVRGNNVYYFPRTPPRSRGHVILSRRRRGYAARKVHAAAAQMRCDMLTKYRRGCAAFSLEERVIVHVA